MEIIRVLFGVSALLAFLAVIIGGFYLIYRYSIKVKEENLERDRRREQERIENYKRVKDKYFNSIDNLKYNPTNPDIKIYALETGREYAELTRKYAGYEGITLFDEVALTNDINAACAGATISMNEVNSVRSSSIDSSTSSVSSKSIEERLAKLLELRNKDLINGQEYETQRQKILDEI